MIKVVLMDCDGPIIKREKYFSQRLMDLGFKLDRQKITDFFRNEFLLCETGKADLKEELQKRIKDWGWDRSLDELLDFWFTGEAATDPNMISNIKALRQQGIMCYLVTDQEKYRTEYLRNVVGLENYFDKIYSSCDVGYLKKDERFWEKVYKDIPSCPKEEILVWDDDQTSINTARQFGFRAELFSSFKGYKETIEQYLI